LSRLYCNSKIDFNNRLWLNTKPGMIQKYNGIYDISNEWQNYYLYNVSNNPGINLCNTNYNSLELTRRCYLNNTNKNSNPYCLFSNNIMISLIVKFDNK